MSKNKQAKRATVRKDDGYPFDTGDWEKWSNKKKLDWMINLRDKLRDKYKKTLNVSDESIAQMSVDIEAMKKVVLGDKLREEFDAAQTTAGKASSPRETARLLGELIDDICANDYYKARCIGYTDEQIDKMRSDHDKYLGEIEQWERRENAKKILGFAPPAKPPTDKTGDTLRAQPGTTFDDIDDKAFKAALAAGDEETAHREFDEMIKRLEAKAARDPVFAKWFEEFRDDQEKLLRWDETIGDDDED